MCCVDARDVCVSHSMCPGYDYNLSMLVVLVHLPQSAANYHIYRKASRSVDRNFQSSAAAPENTTAVNHILSAFHASLVMVVTKTIM